MPNNGCYRRWASTAPRPLGIELVRYELRQVGSRGRFGLGEKGRGVLLHEAVQRGLFPAVALVVDRGAIGARWGGRAMAACEASEVLTLGRL